MSVRVKITNFKQSVLILLVALISQLIPVSALQANMNDRHNFHISQPLENLHNGCQLNDINATSSKSKACLQKTPKHSYCTDCVNCVGPCSFPILLTQPIHFALPTLTLNYSTITAYFPAGQPERLYRPPILLLN